MYLSSLSIAYLPLTGDSPLPDLSALDEISQDDWEQMISGMDGNTSHEVLNLGLLAMTGFHIHTVRNSQDEVEDIHSLMLATLHTIHQ